MPRAHDSRTYLILGASGGIGSAAARRLAGAGATLALAATNEDKLKSLAESLDAETWHGVIDATQPAQVVNAAKDAAERFGRLDGIINAVGSILLKPADRTSDDEFEAVLRLNLWSALGTVQAAAATMRPAGGSVILFATAAARTGLPNHEAIAAAKGGVIALAQSAAATYASQNIRVNCIAPGLVDTPGAKGVTSSDVALKASQAMHPLNRIGTPNNIAPAIDWLLLPDSDWITGQVIGIDGGLATARPRQRM